MLLWVLGLWGKCQPQSCFGHSVSISGAVSCQCGGPDRKLCFAQAGLAILSTSRQQWMLASHCYLSRVSHELNGFLVNDVSCWRQSAARTLSVPEQQARRHAYCSKNSFLADSTWPVIAVFRTVFEIPCLYLLM